MRTAGLTWEDWQVKDFTGIEVWNWGSQWRDAIKNKPMALYFAYLKQEAPITGPYPEAMAFLTEQAGKGRSRPLPAQMPMIFISAAARCSGASFLMITSSIRLTTACFAAAPIRRL